MKQNNKTINYKETLDELNKDIESANAHSLHGIGFKLFDAMRPFIQEKDFDKVAKNIRDTVNKFI